MKGAKTLSCITKMTYNIKHIAKIISATTLQQGNDALIEHILTDSRKLLFPETSIFFAMQGQGRHGNTFINNLHQKGVRNFVVDNNFKEVEKYTDANFLVADDVLVALQTLASYHRHQFQYPVIGITGSNGKTIVKEWLNQLLGEDENIVRNPKSYNSQVGVPLSVWRMNEAYTLGIFESGISQKGEMENLQKIIDPEIGIVTFIGSAHAEGFTSIDEKINEKLLLFKNSKQIIFCADDEKLNNAVANFINTQNSTLKIFTWSKKNNASLFVKSTNKKDNATEIICEYYENQFSFSISFTDEASIHNAITCCCTLLLLNKSASFIAEKMKHLRPVEMRMELKQGLNNCYIINDGYSADLQSLSISLDFLEQQKQQQKHTVILSDVLQSGKDADNLYSKIAAALSGKNITRFIGIGKEISAHANSFSSIKETSFYPTTEVFLQTINTDNFTNEIILLKGARIFRFEEISKVLEQKAHETRLEINLNALRHNLKVYKQLLQPNVKTMAMVKAFGYGSGSAEVANVLQHAGVDYLAVAYVDEAVELRKAGITLPIMVLNTEAASFENVVKYKIEPELYSFDILYSFNKFLQQKNIENFPIHIKIDTGMRRLGFEENDIEKLCQFLTTTKNIKVVSVFSHLAASDAENFDAFTKQQAQLFIAASNTIEKAIGYNFIKHLANSSAIYRHPNLQMDMIRLGIGLYGVDSSPIIQHRLQHVTTLKTTISQIKNLKKGESIGYSRKGIALEDTRTATVRIGYADGYSRILSNGKGKMLVNGNPAPVIGNVCMDMTMLDITGIDAHEGDEVIVFGEEPTVTNVAEWAETISYEILTNISQRVKRVYFEE
jgi:Alr-MurF fusion protein